jgi:hypothetical protein
MAALGDTVIGPRRFADRSVAKKSAGNPVDD